MKTLYTAEAISKGAGSGTIQTPDGLLNVTLGNPLQQGENLFAVTLTAIQKQKQN